MSHAVAPVMKYVLVSGGVVSGLGKGVTASSIGVILKNCGHRVTSVKIGMLSGSVHKCSDSRHCKFTADSIRVSQLTLLYLLLQTLTSTQMRVPCHRSSMERYLCLMTVARYDLQPGCLESTPCWTFVLASTALQVDLDLGNYERFLDISLTRKHNLTTGKIYQVRPASIDSCTAPPALQHADAC